MSTLDEFLNHKSIIALNIIKGFEQSVDKTPVFFEEDFIKAQKEGLIEVFEVDAVSAFSRKIEKALGENPDANMLLEIEKALRDLSKLVKVRKQDSKGRMMTYYVRANSEKQLANTKKNKQESQPHPEMSNEELYKFSAKDLHIAADKYKKIYDDEVANSGKDESRRVDRESLAKHEENYSRMRGAAYEKEDEEAEANKKSASKKTDVKQKEDQASNSSNEEKDAEKVNDKKPIKKTDPTETNDGRSKGNPPVSAKKLFDADHNTVKSFFNSFSRYKNNGVNFNDLYGIEVNKLSEKYMTVSGSAKDGEIFKNLESLLKDKFPDVKYELTKFTKEKDGRNGFKVKFEKSLSADAKSKMSGKQIIKGFEQPVDETPVFSEEDFVKAQEEGLVEVFEVDAVSAFQRKIEKALGENPDANALLEIEKAKRDLSKLVKVRKQDSKGRMMTYYVRATDKAKGQKEGGEAGKKPLTAEQVGKKMAATEKDKHYILHHNDGSKIVVKRFGHGAIGEPNFLPVNEHGEHQSDKAHSFPAGHIVDVEPYPEMDKKVADVKEEKKRKFQASATETGSGEPKLKGKADDKEASAGTDSDAYIKELEEREKAMRDFHNLDDHEAISLGVQHKSFDMLTDAERKKVAKATAGMDAKYQHNGVKFTKGEARRLRHLADTDPKKAYDEAKRYSDSYDKSENKEIFGQPISEIKAEYDAVMAYAKTKMGAEGDNDADLANQHISVATHFGSKSNPVYRTLQAGGFYKIEDAPKGEKRIQIYDKDGNKTHGVNESKEYIEKHFDLDKAKTSNLAEKKKELEEGSTVSIGNFTFKKNGKGYDVNDAITGKDHYIESEEDFDKVANSNKWNHSHADVIKKNKVLKFD